MSSKSFRLQNWGSRVPCILTDAQTTAAANDQVVVAVIVQIAKGGGAVHPVVKRADIAGLALIGHEIGVHLDLHGLKTSY